MRSVRLPGGLDTASYYTSAQKLLKQRNMSPPEPSTINRKLAHVFLLFCEIHAFTRL